MVRGIVAIERVRNRGNGVNKNDGKTGLKAPGSLGASTISNDLWP
jgi:hypothetical protein